MVGFAGHLWSKINKAWDLVSKDVDRYKTLCFKLVELLQKDEAEGNFWFEAFENLMSNCSDDNYCMEEDVCKWDDLNHLYSRYGNEYKKFKAHSWQVRDCFFCIMTMTNHRMPHNLLSCIIIS